MDASTEQPAELATAEVWALVRRRAVTLVETLGPMYFRQTHLPGAINLPPDQVHVLAVLALPDLAAGVVTYASGAADDGTARVVAEQLLELGYRRVATYPDGKLGWVEAGLPVERDVE